jgi:hypothetical protein
VPNVTADPMGASMDADVDLLLTTVLVTADDLLPPNGQETHAGG